MLSTLTFFLLAMLWAIKKHIIPRRNKKRNNKPGPGSTGPHNYGHYEGYWD